MNISSKKKENKWNHMKRLIITSISENRVYWILFLVQALVLLFTMMFTSTSPFGKGILLTNDGYLQIYPGYVNAWNSVHDGSYFNLISSDQTIFFTKGASTIQNIVLPYNYLTLLLVPEALLNAWIDFLYAFHFCITPLFFTYYLTHRHGKKMNKTDYRLIPIGLAYGLSLYAIAFIAYKGFCYMSYLPLLILGLEKVIYEHKYAFYVIVLAVFMMLNPYYAFILCEFLFLYFLSLHFDSIKDFFEKTLRFGLTSIISALLSCVVLLPFFSTTTNMAYSSVDQETIPSIRKFYTNFLNIINLNKIFTEPVEVTEEEWRASIYCGLGIILFLSVYAVNSKIVIGERIKRIILIALIFLAFNNALLNFAFHGFHYQSMVPDRFACFFVFLLILCFYETLMDLEEINRMKLFFGIGISCAFFSICWSLYTKKLDLAFAVSIAFILIYLFTSLIYFRKKDVNSKKYTKWICYILLTELILNSFATLHNKVGAATDRLFATNTSIKELTADLPDIQDDFVNTEYVGTNYFSISNFGAIHTITTFSGNVTGDTLYTLNKWGVHHYTNLISYGIGNPLSDMMLHVKYNIVDATNDESFSIYPVTREVNNLTLHENPYYLPFGFAVDKNDALVAWDKKLPTDYDNLFLYQNDFAASQGIDSLYQVIDLNEVSSEEEMTDPSLSYVIVGEPYKYLESNNSIKLYRKLSFKIANGITGPIYISMNDSLIYLGEADADNHIFEAPMQIEDLNKPNFAIATYQEENMQALYQKFASQTTTDTKLTSSSVFSKITVHDDTSVYLGIPYLSGLTIYVDGQQTEAHSLMGGIGIDLPKGSHDIEIRYSIPGLIPGLIITCITLLFIIAYAFMCKKRKYEGKKAPKN